MAKPWKRARKYAVHHRGDKHHKSPAAASSLNLSTPSVAHRGVSELEKGYLGEWDTLTKVEHTVKLCGDLAKAEASAMGRIYTKEQEAQAKAWVFLRNCGLR